MATTLEPNLVLLRSFVSQEEVIKGGKSENSRTEEQSVAMLTQILCQLKLL